MKGSSLLAPALIAGVGAAVAIRRNMANKEPYSFHDRSVFITGGSRGLGLIMARLFAEEGARLTLIARNTEELERAAQDLRARGAEVITIPCDVSDRQQVERAIQQTLDRFGRLDVLVNNAGIIQVGPFEHMQVEDFEQAMGVHMWGPLYTVMAALPHMKRQGEGRIVNVSSIGGKIAAPHLLPYTASKFALTGLSDGLRAELAKDHIHVTTVIPGLMRTGSPVNAMFKGRHGTEYAWFSLLDTLPFTAIGANTAARQIVEACRRGDTALTITVQARLGIIASSVVPNIFARSMQLFNILLPKPAGKEGDDLKRGWESNAQFTRSALMKPTYAAAEENNELSALPPQTDLPRFDSTTQEPA